MTGIIHITEAPEDWQSMPSYVNIGKKSMWIHPYGLNLIKNYTDNQWLTAYLSNITNRMKNNDGFVDALLNLKGKIFICSCPLDRYNKHQIACYGTVLNDIINEITGFTIVNFNYLKEYLDKSEAERIKRRDIEEKESVMWKEAGKHASTMVDEYLESIPKSYHNGMELLDVQIKDIGYEAFKYWRRTYVDPIKKFRIFANAKQT